MHQNTPPSSSSSFPDMNPNNNHNSSIFPEHLKCPRCDSPNTKFCYYNNYNLSQPRHFCKNCRRYWTKGGTLRNIPIGGGTRKISKPTKRPSKSPVTTHPPPFPSLPVQPELKPETEDGFVSVGSSGGGYSMGPFGNLLMEGFNFNNINNNNIINNNNKGDEDVLIGGDGGDGDFRSSFLKLNDVSNNNININENDGENGGCGWPDLSIFTPGSGFH